MNGNAKGELVVNAGGKDYRLHFGWGVLADLQAKHGQDVLQKLEPPKGANDWLPDFGIVCDIIAGALGRYHGAEADRYLVDDILAEHPDLASRLLQAAFPAVSAAGNARKPSRAA